MKKIIFLAVLAIVLNGCATISPSIPKGYSGPTATIQDSEEKIDSGKANLFYLSNIDGKEIKNSRGATIAATYGKGNNLSTVLLKNIVPAENHVFTIVGRTEYAMPARALVSTVYQVKGNVSFTPKQDGNYIIKGLLSEETSSVWIEDVATGETVKKIEVEGSSKLGVFEK